MENSSEEMDNSSKDEANFERSFVINENNRKSQHRFNRKSLKYDEDEKIFELKEVKTKDNKEEGSLKQNTQDDKYTSSISEDQSIDEEEDEPKDQEDEEKDEENKEENHQKYDENYSKDLMIRHWLQRIFLQTIYGSVIDSFTGFLAWSSSFMNVAISFFDEQYLWFDYLDLFLCFIFLIDFIVRMYSSQSRWKYIMTMWSLSQILTIFPIMVFFGVRTDQYPQIFISVSRYLRIIRISDVTEKFFDIGENDVGRKLYNIILSAIMLLYISSGIIMAIENYNRDEPRNYFMYFYFIVVTFSTIGYGDITPVTDAGQMFITSIIIFIIIMIPKQTNELLRLLAMQSYYLRTIYKKNQEIPHIVIAGEVRLPALKNFCQELFHEDHGAQDKHAVVIQKKDPQSDMEIFLNNPQYEGFLYYLAGNAISSKDLDRACLAECDACVLMTDKHTKDAFATDHKNILTGLAMK